MYKASTSSRMIRTLFKGLPFVFSAFLSSSCFLGQAPSTPSSDKPHDSKLTQEVHRNAQPPATTQFTASELKDLVPAPRAADVESPKALVRALHDSISGPGEAFRWDRFRSLFLPTANIGEAGREPDKKQHIMYQPVEAWIQAVKGERPKVSVQEVVYKIHVEQFGSIASAFYSHSALATMDGKTDDIRRVNTCQMLYDGERWWIASVVWNVSPKNWDLPQDMEP